MGEGVSLTKSCEECGQPVDAVRCPACQHRQGGGLFAIAYRGLPKNLISYVVTIASSRLYWGLLLFAIAPMLLLGLHINVVVGMMIYFSLFWFFVFQPLVAAHIQLRPLFTDMGAYLFTGIVGTTFAIIVEGFWFRHGGAVLMRSPVLAVTIPAYVSFVGVTEEFAKQMVVLIVLFWQRSRGRAWPPLTYMMVGVSSGLGFSAVENISYVQRGISFEVLRHAFGYGTTTALTRALYTPFLHAIWAGAAAYCLGVVARRGFRDWWIGLGGIGMAAVFHGIYDASVGIDPSLAIADVAVSYLVFLALLLNDRRLQSGRS